MSDLVFSLFVGVVKVAVVLGFVLGVVPFIVVWERKLIAWIQVRPGPNRVGPWGLLQGIADGIKLFFKEDVNPRGADLVLFYLGPTFTVVSALMALAIVPFGDALPAAWFGGREVTLSIANLDVAVLYLLAITSVGVYGITLAGYSSNSKYPLLGAIRASAQMVSYEVAMGLSVAGVVLVAGTLSLNTMIQQQAGGFWNWYVFAQPVACVLFLIAAMAENNRLPFDLAEAETELTGGFHTEYSSMKFALFFLAEYVSMIVMGSVFVTFFFGGWQCPFGFYLFKDVFDVPLLYVLETFAWWSIKIFLYISFFIVVRATLPRLRYDQLMNLGWKVMLPMALLNLAVAAVCIAFVPAPALHWVLFLLGLAMLYALDQLISQRTRKQRRYAVPGVEVNA